MIKREKQEKCFADEMLPVAPDTCRTESRGLIKIPTQHFRVLGLLNANFRGTSSKKKIECEASQRLALAGGLPREPPHETGKCFRAEKCRETERGNTSACTRCWAAFLGLDFLSVL